MVPSDGDMKVGIIQVNDRELVSLLQKEKDMFQSHYVEMPLSDEVIEVVKVEDGAQIVVSFWNKEVSGKEARVRINWGDTCNSVV